MSTSDMSKTMHIATISLSAFTLLRGGHPGVLFQSNAVCRLLTFPGIELEMVNHYGIVLYQKAGLVPVQLAICCEGVQLLYSVVR